jgi:hypothetical protein
VETNILNPTVNSPLNPDYGYTEDLPSLILSWKPRFGRPYSRMMADGGRQIQMEWNRAAFSTKVALQQWHQQYEQGFFTYADWEAGRYYSGRFAAPPQFIPTGSNNWGIKATFVELPGLPMFAYPANWGVDSIMLDGIDDFGANNVKLTGATWGLSVVAPLGYGGSKFVSGTTNDTAEWQYYGYGFRLWSPTGSTYGIGELSLDGTVLGNVDFYTVATVSSTPVYTSAAQRLGVHRVKLRVTGTKNASSSAFSMPADAVEVMR